MSETEFRVGKAIEICKDQATFEDKVNEIARTTGLKVEDLTEDWGDNQATMRYRGDYVYVRSSNKMFQLINDRNIEEDGELIEASYDNSFEDVFSYKLRWYNGGASFSEVFEEAVMKLENAD